MAQKIDEIFYELGLRTQAVSQGTARAERDFAKLAKFFKDHPERAVVGGAAAMATALIAIGTQATRLAAVVDTSMRKVRNSVAGTDAEFKALQKTIAQMSTMPGGRSQAELAEAAAQIGDMGARDPADVAKRLKIAVDIADASGAQLKSIIESLDLLTDAFGKTTTQAGNDMARMFEITKGKVKLEEMFVVMERGASTMGTLNIGAVDVAKSLTAIVDAGVPAKQAGNVLTSILDQVQKAREEIPKAAGEERASLEQLVRIMGPANIGAKGLTLAIGELASSTGDNVTHLRSMGFGLVETNAIMRVAASATQELRSDTEQLDDAWRKVRESATRNREDLDKLSQTLHNQLNAELIKLGNVTLPVVLRSLRWFVEGIDPGIRKARELAAAIEEINSKEFKPPAPRGGAWNFEGIGGEKPGASGASGARDPIEQFIAAFKETGDRVFEGLDIGQITKVGAAIRSAYPNAEDEKRLGGIIKAMTERVSLLQQEAAAEAAASAVATQKAVKDEADAKNRLQRLEDERVAAERLKKARAEIADVEERLGESLAKGTSSGVDNAKRELDQFIKFAASKRKELGDKITEDEKRILDARQAELEAGLDAVIRKEQEIRELEIRQIFADTTVTQVDNLRLALEETVKKLRELKVPDAEIQKFVGIQNQLIIVTEFLEGVRGAWDTIDAAGWGVEQLGTIETKIAEINVQLNATTEGEEAHNKLLEERTRWLEKHKELFLFMWNLAGGTVPQPKDVNNTRQIAEHIEKSARAALQLADAFGIIDDKASQVLQSIAQVAAGVVETLAVLKKEEHSWMDVVGAALPIAGGVASLIGTLFGDKGPDPEQIRANELRQRNIDALDRLNRTIGNADLALSGKQITGVRSTVAVALRDPSGGTPGRSILGQRLEGMGLSIRDLEEVAESLNIELDDSTPARWRDSLLALDAAMKAAEFTQFADTWAGQLRSLQIEFDLFDITDPVEKVKRLAEMAAGDMGSSFFSTFAALDFNTPEGRAAADELIKQWFGEIEAGTFDVSVLGKMSFAEFTEWLQAVEGLLDDAPGLKDATQAIEALGGFDLSTAEGIKGARDLIADVFKQLESGTQFFNEDGSAFDMLAWLETFEDSVDAAAQALADAAAQMNNAISELEREWDIAGIEDPAVKLQQFIDKIAEFEPAMAAAIGAFDLTSETGRAAALEQILQLYRAARGRLDEEGADKDAIEEQIDLLQRLANMIRGVPAEIAEELVDAENRNQQTDFVRGVQGLTEYTGMRMADYMNTMVQQVRRIDENTRPIREMWASYAPPPGLLPPAIPLFSAVGATDNSQSTRVTIRITGVTINVSAGASDPAAIGNAVRGALSDQVAGDIDRALARRRRRRLRLRGETEIKVGRVS